MARCQQRGQQALPKWLDRHAETFGLHFMERLLNSSLPIILPHLSAYTRINGKVKIFLQIFRGVVETSRRNRNLVHKQDTREGTEPTTAASHELCMGEICPHTSVHSSLSSMSLLRWKTIFLERDSSSSGAISGSSSHCKSKTFSWLWVT